MSTRTFVAIELSSNFRAALAERIRHLCRTLPDERWVDPASLHLTLAFLGDLDDAELAATIEATLAAAAQSSPFRLGPAALGTFGPPQMPRVVWAGVQGDLQLLHRLHADLVYQLARRNLPVPDEHSFTPHLTLARLKPPMLEPERQRLVALLAKPYDQPFNTAVMLVEHIAVMKSELARPAARYTRLETCPLLGAAD